jgi:hypothetical protein
MDSNWIPAVAAACGSLVGGAASAVVTWMTQHSQMIHDYRREMRRERELLYGEFITEASRLAVDAMSHSLQEPDAFVNLYGILGRIRLVADDAVLAAAEACCARIVSLYCKPNLTVEEIRLAFERDRLDPIKDFSVACREELVDIFGG